MPTYVFTSPEGKRYRVTAPEGATQEQAFGMLQAQIGTPAPAEPPAAPPRRESSFTGTLAEAGKGIARGALSLPRLIAENVAKPANEGLPEQMRPRTNPAVEARMQRFYEQIKPNPNASRFEQGVGTTLELGTSMLPFAGGPGVTAARKAAQVAVPVAGGVAGEQVGGETGKALGTLAAPLAQVGAARVVNPKQISTANKDVAAELIRNGIPVLPKSADAGWWKKTEGYIGGRERLELLAREKAQPALQKLAQKETGVPFDKLSAANLDAASKEVAQRTYEPIRQLSSIYLGKAKTHPYNQALDAIAAKYGSIDQAHQLMSRIGKNGDLRKQTMPAEVVLERISQLRAGASDAFNNNQTLYGRALREVADAIEDQIERNLRIRGPQVLDAYRAGRTQIAKNNAVKDMLVDKDTGIIDVTKAQKLKENGVKLTGGLDTIAKAGSPMYSFATKPPVEREGHPWSDYGFYGAGALGGLMTGGAGFALAGVPLARVAARHHVVSRPFQESLLKNLVDKQGLFGAQIPPPGLTALGAVPLFSQGDQ